MGIFITTTKIIKQTNQKHIYIYVKTQQYQQQHSHNLSHIQHLCEETQATLTIWIRQCWLNTSMDSSKFSTCDTCVSYKLKIKYVCMLNMWFVVHMCICMYIDLME